jgi:uncharacterized protein (DUF2147 family)
MKYVILLFLTLGFLNYIQAQEPSDKIFGIWFNEDKTSKIELYKTGETYSGKIIWLAELEKNPENKPKDINNPNPEMRNKEILGLDIITGLQYSRGIWVNGMIYAPKRGVYAKCTIELVSDERLKIIVSKSGLTRTQIWTRK